MGKVKILNNKLVNSRSFFVVCFMALIFLSCYLKLTHIFHIPAITHDEAISYQVATLNEGLYANVVNSKVFPYGSWVDTDEWQRFSQFNSGFLNFKQIQNDLTYYDVHPPLYFWLLHVWIYYFGVSVWSGPILNILIDLLNSLVFFFSCLIIFKDKIPSFLCLFLYLLSPGVMAATFIARSYSLFSFFSLILFLIYYLSYRDKYTNIAGTFILSFLITFLGLLTHYYFGFVACGFFVSFFVCSFVRGNSFNFIYKTFTFAFSSLCALGAMLYINNGFFIQFFSFKGQGQDFTYYDLFLRMMKTVLALMGFVVPVDRRSISLFSVILLLLLIIAFVYIFLFTRKHKNRSNFMLDRNVTLFLGVSFIVPLSFMVFLYLCFFTHQAVMGPQYLSPLFFLIPLIIFCFIPKSKVFTCILLSIFLVSGFYYSSPFKNVLPEKIIDIASSDSVLIDNCSRGILPILVNFLPSDKKVYCAMQDDLIKDFSWSLDMGQTVLYLSVLQYGNTEDKRKIIFDYISSGYDVALTEGGSWGLYGLGQSFNLTRK